MATKPPGLSVTRDDVSRIKDAFRILGKRELLVGFPEDTTNRDPDPAEPPDLTNAELAYIHDNGAPEANIPARPFMDPAMQEQAPYVANDLVALAASAVTKAGKVNIEAGFHKIGIRVQVGIQKKINEGIPPPLSERTLRERARKGRKGAKEELAARAQGLPPSTTLAKPLIDTAQMRNAVNYVIRDRTKRKK